MVDEVELHPAPESAGGAPVNRDRGYDPGVIEGEVAQPSGAKTPDAAAPQAPPREETPSREEIPAAMAIARRFDMSRAFAAGVLGGLAAAAIAAAVWWVWGAGGGDNRLLGDRFAALDSQEQRDAASIAAFDKRMTALEAGNGALATKFGAADLGVARLNAEATALKSGLDGLKGDLAGLDARVAKLESAPPPEVKTTAPAAAPPDSSAINARLDKLEAALAAPKTEARANAETARQTGDAPAVAAIAEALNEKLAAGLPYQWELTALQRLGVNANALSALAPFAASGAPTAGALSASFAKLEPDLLARSAKEAPSGVMNRFLAHMQGLVQVRDLGETPGDDPQAVVSQIEAATARGDYAAAMARLGKLPEGARDVAKEWSAAIAARQGAYDALRSIRSVALAAIAGGDN
jgi:hypothetical protein